MRSLFYSFFVPALFVWLWSTGFIGAKYGLPFAEPFTLLLIRMLLTLVLLAGLAWIMKTRWPGWRGAGHLAVTGMLVHGCYLGGVYYAIQDGMASGIVSLIVGLQPLVTAAAAVVFLKESVTGRQWVGLALGLVGVALVLLEKFGVNGSDSMYSPWSLLWAVFALAGISMGTVYQKRYGTNADLVAGSLIQFSAAAALFAVGAFALETREVEWTLQLQLSMAWLVVGLSIGAVLLLMWLIRQGAASQVASLFYLVPPVTALEAFLLFDERLGALAMTGGLIAIVGVALVVTQKKPA
ncbi:peptide ABC transporter ATP-binding protein [Marinobacter sp. EhC06]|jgi:drug/metabolite transporter (DMT)-like permease|uniref:DMT family transporter n=1 Tax=Marinobacter TaxID=2742 RepID=UPI0007D94D0F|nr:MULTISPECIES: DMT family transporter [Marinobacter]MCD1647788.1 DMT family transporter [Marinobacter adhaerens]OAN92372.1 peptide ABC transporter ATP-binding protein [Marinobacter sp. EhN04]OAN95950.1 peptide ABC transporter ATP-binding protein [Marinobacter sp. EhC06]